MSWRDAPIVEEKPAASQTKVMPSKPQEDDSWFMRNVADPLGSREAFQAYGATLGAIAPTVGAAGRGVSMLPHPLLKAVGYGLTALAGGVAGGMAAESARDVVLPEGRRDETFKQQLNRNITDETTAQTFGYAAPLIASPFKKVAGAVTDALTPEARKLYDQAKSFGVDLAPANLKDSGFVDGVRKVFGVMPYVGSSWNKTAGKQTNQVEGAVNDLLNEIAPNATLYDAGVNLVKGAESTYKDFTSEAGKRYNAFREAAKALPNPNVFRSNNLRAAATEIGARRTAERIPDVNMPRDRLEDITEGLINAPEHLSIEQLRGFSRSINDEVARKSLAGEDVKDLLQLKKATEASMNDIDRTLLPEGSNVAESLAEANKFYANEIKKFQTAEAKKFGRVDKNMFDVGYVKAGTMPDDQAMMRIFNSKSPEALRQLRDVAGADAFNVAARKHLEESMRGVVKDIGENTRIIDPEDFANKFQLDTEEGAAVMKELLSASNVKPERVNQLLDVMRSVQRIQPTDPSTFLARRLVLGGGMMASAYGLGVPAAVSFGYIANRFGNALANPKALDSLIKSADKTISPRQQWAAMYRGVSALYGKDSDEAKDLRTRKDELIGAFEEYKKNPWIDAPIAEEETPTRIDVTPADMPQQPLPPQSSLSNQDFMRMATASPFDMPRQQQPAQPMQQAAPQTQDSFVQTAMSNLASDEGLRTSSYDDTVGARTVGYGFNMDSGIAKKIWKQAGIQAPFDAVYRGRAAISTQDAQRLKMASVDIALNDARSLFPNFDKLSDTRKDALLNLSYQMGVNRLAEFGNMRKAIENGNFTEAARHLLKSKYAKQVPARAKEQARKLMVG
jgi:lysozyme